MQSSPFDLLGSFNVLRLSHAHLRKPGLAIFPRLRRLRAGTSSATVRGWQNRVRAGCDAHRLARRAPAS